VADVNTDVLHAKTSLTAQALQPAIFNSANFSSIATDAQGVIQIFNVGAERMLGYTAAEVMNTVTPADLSDPQEVIARAARLSVEFGTAVTPGFEALVFKASRGIEDIYELTYIRKDGSRFPAIVSVTALRDPRAAIIGYLLIGIDNTARKQDEEARRKSEQFEAAPDAIVVMKGGVFLDCNRQAELVFGRGKADIIGHSPVEFSPFAQPDGRPSSEGAAERINAALTGSAERFDWQLSRADGTVFDAEVHLVRVNIGGHVCLQAVIRDVSTRKRAEQELHHSLELLDQTGRLAKIGGWQLDVDTQTLSWTDEVYRIHEVDLTIRPSLAEAIRFYAPEARPVVTAAIQAATDAGTPWDLELPLITAQGRHIWVRAQGTAERHGGKTIRLYGVFQDITERKRTEGVEARLTAILETTPDLVSIADIEGRLVYMNRAGRTMLGIGELADVARYNLRQFLNAANAQIVLAEGIPTAIRDGAWSGETEMLTLDGREVAVSQVILTHKAPDGTVAFLSTIARDITDRKRAEDVLRRSEMFLARSQRMAHLGSWSLEPETGTLTWSEELYRIYGVSPGVFAPTVDALMALVHSDDRSAMQAWNSALLSGQKPGPLEFRAVRPDGTVRVIRGAGDVLRDSAGNKRGLLIGTAQDITEYTQAAEALLERERRLSSIYETVADILFYLEVEKDGRYRFASINQAFISTTGLEYSQVVGKRVDEVISEPSLTLVLEKYAEAIREKKMVRWEETSEYPKGRLTGEVSIVPVLDGAGNCTHLVGATHDITERLRLEAQFRQSQKMESVGQLASGIAHDFNNLLTVINGMSDLVLAQVSQNDLVYADVQEIHRAGERAAALTRQLLAFSRQQILAPQVLNVDTVIAGMEDLIRRLLGEDIDLVIVPTPDVGCVKADPGQIEQVITNLAVNARDAMPRGGRLTIETQNVTIDEDYTHQHGLAEPTGPYVLLAVSDSGVGMDEATRARIFEPFFTTKGPGKGTGLGLSTAFGIVQQSRGFIYVYSEVGHGTSFKIYLPRVNDVAGTWCPLRAPKLSSSWKITTGSASWPCAFSSPPATPCSRRALARTRCTCWRDMKDRCRSCLATW
jgi:PAS domain S-box-containing protein